MRAAVAAGCLAAAVAFFPATASAKQQATGPVQLVFEDGSGRVRTSRAPDVASLLAGCGVSRPAGVDTVTPVTLVARDAEQVVHVGRSAQGALYVQSEGGPLLEDTWCAASGRLADALASAAAAPSPRTAWTVLIVAFGAIAIAVSGIALTGRGLGPAPEVAIYPDEHGHEHHEEESAGTAEVATEAERPASGRS